MSKKYTYRRVRRKAPALLAVAALSSLGACSPYGYQAEIAAFEGATDRLTDAVQETREDLRSAPRNTAFWRVYDSPQDTEIDVASCISFDVECTLLVDGQPVLVSSEAERAVDAALADIEKLGAYAAALKAVTDAEDRAAFRAATGELGDSVSGLVSLTPGGAVAAGPAKAAVEAAGLLTSFFLDQARLRRLRAAVTAVDPHLQSAATEIASGLMVVYEVRIGDREQRGDNAQEALRKARSEAARIQFANQLLDRVEEIRALQSARPEPFVETIATAHAALAAALASPGPDPSGVAEAISEFVEVVASLTDALRNR